MHMLRFYAFDTFTLFAANCSLFQWSARRLRKNTWFYT